MDATADNVHPLRDIVIMRKFALMSSRFGQKKSRRTRIVGFPFHGSCDYQKDSILPDQEEEEGLGAACRRMTKAWKILVKHGILIESHCTPDDSANQEWQYGWCVGAYNSSKYFSSVRFSSQDGVIDTLL